MPQPDQQIEIRARVVEYRIGAMIDRFEGGRSASYDATILEVLAPAHMCGTRLTIYHDRPAAEDSPWGSIGNELTFSIDVALLDGNMQLFDGAVRQLRVTGSSTR